MSEAEAQPEPPEKPTKDCPFCGETIKAAAIKCRFCGEDLKAHEEAIEKPLYEGNPAPIYSVWHWPWLIFTLGFAFIYYYFRSRATRFVISTHRIKIIKGILSKAEHNLELFRVDDIALQRPLPMRLMGFSTIILRTSDRDTPTLIIWGVRNAESLAEDIRECVLAERKRLGVLIHSEG